MSSKHQVAEKQAKTYWLNKVYIKSNMSWYGCVWK